MIALAPLRGTNKLTSRWTLFTRVVLKSTAPCMTTDRSWTGTSCVNRSSTSNIEHPTLSLLGRFFDTCSCQAKLDDFFTARSFVALVNRTSKIIVAMLPSLSSATELALSDCEGQVCIVRAHVHSQGRCTRAATTLVPPKQLAQSLAMVSW